MGCGVSKKGQTDGENHKTQCECDAFDRYWVYIAFAFVLGLPYTFAPQKLPSNSVHADLPDYAYTDPTDPYFPHREMGVYLLLLYSLVLIPSNLRRDAGVVMTTVYMRWCVPVYHITQVLFCGLNYTPVTFAMGALDIASGLWCWWALPQSSESLQKGMLKRYSRTGSADVVMFLSGIADLAVGAYLFFYPSEWLLSLGFTAPFRPDRILTIQKGSCLLFSTSFWLIIPAGFYRQKDSYLTWALWRLAVAAGWAVIPLLTTTPMSAIVPLSAFYGGIGILVLVCVAVDSLLISSAEAKKTE